MPKRTVHRAKGTQAGAGSIRSCLGGRWGSRMRRDRRAQEALVSRPAFMMEPRGAGLVLSSSVRRFAGVEGDCVEEL